MYATIFKLIWPHLQRFLAQRAAAYLEERRQQRLEQRAGKESLDTLLTEQARAIVTPLIQPSVERDLTACPPPSGLARVNAIWFTLSGVLLGSALALILAQIFKRED